MNHFPRWLMQVLFAHIFAGLGIPHYLSPSEAALLMKDVEESSDASDAATHKKSTWLGMGSSNNSLFHFFHLRCSSANMLRESMKPDGTEAFRSLTVLPPSTAQHALSRTTGGHARPGYSLDMALFQGLHPWSAGDSQSARSRRWPPTWMSWDGSGWINGEDGSVG